MTHRGLEPHIFSISCTDFELVKPNHRKFPKYIIVDTTLISFFISTQYTRHLLYV